MMRFGRIGCLAVALWSVVAAAPGDAPEAYRLRLPVTASASSAVQRLTLPPAVLAASRSPDLADLRVFDATNRIMPIARTDPAAAAVRRVVLPALPILGAADALTVTGVSLRLDDRGQARVAAVDGTVSPAAATIVGVLFDARAIEARASAMTLDVDMPRSQPVTFTVEASSDLKNWRSLGSTTHYRAPGEAGAPVLRLGGPELTRDYLRVTWRAASRLLAPVAVRRATLITRGDTTAPTWVAATPPRFEDAHVIDVAVPFASSLVAMAVVATGDDAIVPVRIFGRRDTEQPWTMIGQGTAVRAGSPATDIRIGGGSFAMMRIEADDRSAGFTSPPALRFGFAPRAILFLAAGRPPFTLAAGRAGAADAYLPSSSLMSQAEGRSPATAVVPAVAVTLQLQSPDDAGASRRQVILWTVLIAATMLLAAMAVVLWWRQGAA